MSISFWLWQKSIDLQKGIEDRKGKLVQKQAAKMKLTAREHQNWLLALMSAWMIFAGISGAITGLVLKLLSVHLPIWAFFILAFSLGLLSLRMPFGRRMANRWYKWMLEEDAKKQSKE